MITASLTRTVAQIRDVVVRLPRPVGLVPTMGALHEGHLALIRTAADECASVVVSIFVNPTQFGPGEDFARYPRDEARDVALVSSSGADAVFAPPTTEMYHDRAATTVSVAGPLTALFEGAERPGHYDGVATVVTKLFAIVSPDRAYFGRKDAQQLAVIRRLVDDLDLPVEIVPVETVREPDGLAMSSRNAYLTAEQRAKAPELQRALLAGRAVAAHGPRAVVNEVTTKLVLGFPPYLEPLGDPDAPPRVQFSVDYVAVVDPDTFQRVEERHRDEELSGVATGSVRLRSTDLIIAAARLDETRLLDNVAIGEPTTEASHEPDPQAGPASHEEERPWQQ